MTETFEKLDLQTPDFVDENIAKLAELFPNCVTEKKNDKGELEHAIDFDALRQEFSSSIVEGPAERYSLNWPGKRKALVAANTPINKTLRPCRAESVDFDTTKNIFIEGDNLDALKLLRETYLDKIKMIYIDPPYNTGRDFIYNDSFTADSEAYKKDSSLTDEEGNRLLDEDGWKQNTTANGRFHSDWLSTIYPLLKRARDLLTDDGLIFISNDDWENHNLKKICDEIFGEDNFINHRQIIWHLPDGTNKGLIARAHEYILGYAKNIKLIKPFHRPKDKNDESIKHLTNAPDPKNKISEIIFPAGLRFEGDDQEIIGIVGGKKEPIYIKGVMKFENNKLQEDVILESSWKNKAQIEEFFLKGSAMDEKGQSLTEVFFKSNGKPMYIKKLTTLSPKSVQQFKYSKFEGELRDHFNFDNPKPISMISWLSLLTTEKHSLILDFFAGSGTTAHAVMQLNAEDGGNRKCISVQLPEITDEKSEAFKAGYKNIAEISKERIRRAGKKIKEDGAGKEGIENLDIGFRVFKIDSSNMEDVHLTPDDTSPDFMDKLAGNIKPDRSSEDLLFQVLLDWGVDLSLSIERTEIDGKQVFFVDDNALAACFDKDINEEFVKKLAERQPLRVVFRDDGFANDAVKINIEQIFKLKSPATDIKVI